VAEAYTAIGLWKYTVMQKNTILLSQLFPQTASRFVLTVNARSNIIAFVRQCN